MTLSGVGEGMSAAETKILTDIAVKVGQMEVMQVNNTKSLGDMADSMNRLVNKLEQSDDVAREAMQSSKTAHHRLDKIDKIIFWTGTTIVGAIILAIIKITMSGGS